MTDFEPYLIVMPDLLTGKPFATSWHFVNEIGQIHFRQIMQLESAEEELIYLRFLHKMGNPDLMAILEAVNQKREDRFARTITMNHVTE